MVLHEGKEKSIWWRPLNKDFKLLIYYVNTIHMHVFYLLYQFVCKVPKHPVHNYESFCPIPLITFCCTHVNFTIQSKKFQGVVIHFWKIFLNFHATCMQKVCHQNLNNTEKEIISFFIMVQILLHCINN